MAVTVNQLRECYARGEAPVHPWVVSHALYGALYLGDGPVDAVLWLCPDTDASFPLDEWREVSTLLYKYTIKIYNGSGSRIPVEYVVYKHSDGFRWVAAFDDQEGGGASIFVNKKHWEE